MTKYATGNPVLPNGSADPRDLFDNAQNLDVLVNSQEKTEHADRLGVPRKTWHGMQTAFNEFMSASDIEFHEFLISSGYTGTGSEGAYEDYDTDGPLTITELNQVFTKDGEFYRLKPDQPTPYTTTTWATDENRMIPLGDAVLRQELGGSPADGNGSLLVGGSVTEVDGLSNLTSMPTGGLSGGESFRVTQMAAADFVWVNGDQSALVSNSPKEWYAPDGQDGSSGAYRRIPSNNGITGLEYAGPLKEGLSISDASKMYSYNGELYIAPAATPADPVIGSIPLDESNFRNVREKKDYTTNPVDIFIVYGQSNALGYAGDVTHDFARSEQDPNAVRWTGTKLAPLYWNMEYSSGEKSSGHAWTAFCKRYGDITGRKSIIIPCAKGGTSLNDLSKGSQAYTDMLSWVTGCKNYITNNGYQVGKTSVLFSQGESDVDIGTSRDDYLSMAGQLWSDIKADTSASLLAISSLGSVVEDGEARCSLIRYAQYRWADTNPDVIIAYDLARTYSADNSLLRDGVHYTLRGYHLMGFGMAEAVAIYRQGHEIPESHAFLERYGRAESVANHLRRKVAFTLQKQSGTWSILEDSQFSNTSAIDVTDQGDRLQVTTSSPVSGVLSISSALNATGNRAGIYTRVNYQDSTVTVRFELDSVLTLRMDTGIVYVLNNDAASNSGSFYYQSTGTGKGVLTVQSCVGRPIASNSTGAACQVSRNSSTEMSVKAWDESFSLSDEELYINIGGVLATPSQVPDGSILTICMDSRA